MAYLQENIDTIENDLISLEMKFREIDEQLSSAKKVMIDANALGFNLSDEIGNIGDFAKNGLDYGFDDYEEDEQEEYENVTEEIYEYANQIEYLLSDTYRDLKKMFSK